jgi:hypothetical protein
MSMNPFEIRLELLKMAKEMMDRQYDEASSAYWTTIHEYGEKWNKSVEDLVKQTQYMKPEHYGTADMMEKAKELYEFVSKKD